MATKTFCDHCQGEIQEHYRWSVWGPRKPDDEVQELFLDFCSMGCLYLWARATFRPPMVPPEPEETVPFHDPAWSDE